jgi:putative nucleotidyltransferase with HDIG domain
MSDGGRPYGWRLFRATAFVLGLWLIVAVTRHMGFSNSEVIGVVAVGGLLSAAVIELPWGGFLFPSDAVLLCLCLLSGSPRVAVMGIGAGIVAGSVTSKWKGATMVAAARNAVAAVATVGVWRNLVPSVVVVVDRSELPLGSAGRAIGDWVFSARAIPALLVCSLTYLVVASVVETLLRRRREFAFAEFWLLNFGSNFHHILFTVVLGAVVSVAYRDAGLLALIVFAFPVLLTRDALKRSLDLRLSRIEALKALSSSVDARDKYTYDHSNRVSRLATILAREMGFAETAVEAIQSGALLHDIGKLGVDTGILTKPGPLDYDEKALIRQHPVRSAEVVSRVELLKNSVGIVRHHHERPDGTGYPEGLKGHEIPAGARILNVADAFDAMISDRPYRKRKTVGEAVDELRQGSGSEFDPVVVEYLTRMIGNRDPRVHGLDSD